MRSSLLIASFVLGALASPLTQLSALLERRQSTNPYPPQCNDSCSKVQNAVNSCVDDKCFCTPTNIQNFAACLQCTVNIIGQQRQLQSTLDQVVNDCNSEGFNVPSETLTGGSGGSTPTGGPSPSDTSDTFTFSAPVTSSPLGTGTSNPSNPTATGPATTEVTSISFPPVTQPQASPTTGGSNGLPTLGGGSGGGALGMGVPQAFVATILTGVCLAIVAL